MKKLGVSTVLALSAFSIALAFSPLKVSATTVTLDLISTSSTSADGGYVYPYNFSVNDSTSLTALMCISYNDHIEINESWTAIIDPISTSDDEEAAWLFNDAQTYNSDIVADQEAVWYLFDPVSSGDSNGNNAQLSKAENFVTENPNDTSFYSQFELYVPVPPNDENGLPDWGSYGEPQTFIGNAPPGVTPEPSSLLLLGTGLFAFAAVLYRRSRVRVAGLSSSGA